MQLQPLELVGDRVAGPGQEARAYPKGLVAEPQVEARRLDLVGIERRATAASAPLSNSAPISRSGRIPEAKALASDDRETFSKAPD